MRDLIQKNNSWLKIEQKVDFDGSKKEFCVQNQLWTKVKPKQFFCIENEKTDFFFFFAETDPTEGFGDIVGGLVLPMG